MVPAMRWASGRRRGGGSRGEEATKGVRGHGGVARGVVLEGLAGQEELKVTDDTEARDLDGATGGDVVADTGEILGELAGGGGLAEGGRPVVVEVGAGRD